MSIPQSFASMRSATLLLLLAFLYGCSDAPTTAPGTTTTGDPGTILLTEISGNSPLDARIVSIRPDSTDAKEIVRGLLLAPPRNGRMVWSSYVDTSLNISAI